MKMTAERVTRSSTWSVDKIHHCALSRGRSSVVSLDIVLHHNFLNMYDDAAKAGVTVIGLRNVSDTEMEEKQETGAAEVFRIVGFLKNQAL